MYTIKRHMKLLDPQKIVSSKHNELVSYNERLFKSMDVILSRSRLRLDGMRGRAEAGNPLNVLSRGYALVFEGGRLIKAPDQVENGDMLDIRLADGVLRATVVKQEKKD